MIIWCGVSADTRMALGGGDTGSYHTERRAYSPASPNIISNSGRLTVSLHSRVSYLPPSSPPNATRVSTDTPHHMLTVPLLKRPTEAQAREPLPFAI